MDSAITLLDLIGVGGIFGLLCVVQGFQIYLIFQVWKSGREGRKDLHKRMDSADKHMVEHEKTCAERWGEVKTKLDQINECYNKHEK